MAEAQAGEPLSMVELDPELELDALTGEQEQTGAKAERLPDAEAVQGLSTPAILELLELPAVLEPANAALRAAVFRVLAEREGVGFARKVLKGRAPDLEGVEQAGGEQLSLGGGRISAAPAPRSEQKDAAPGGVGVTRQEKQASESTASARAADSVRSAKRRVVEEAMAPEKGSNANGHVSYWVSDEALVKQEDGAYRVEVDKLSLHSRIHVRDAGDAHYSSIEDFAPYFGGAFDTAFAEYSGIVLHEQQHVSELRQAWEGLVPSLQASVAAIKAGSPEEAEAAYRQAFDAFDEGLFVRYFASGEVAARSKEWAHYHGEYEKRFGKPTGATGGAAQAASAGATHGQKESAVAQGQAKMAEALARDKHADYEQVKPKMTVTGKAIKRLEKAKGAIEHTKQVFAYGAGNQAEALRASDFNSYFRMKAMRDPTCWRLTESVKPVASANREALTAAKADLLHGGNCGEHAQVGFDWLRVNAAGETLNRSAVEGLDHAFVIMGDLSADKDNDLAVCDPWPTAATACVWEDHFAFTPDRKKINTRNTMTADGQDVKAVIAAGLTLTPKGKAMAAQKLGEKRSKEIMDQGMGGWIWDHSDAAAPGKDYDYESE